MEDSERFQNPPKTAVEPVQFARKGKQGRYSAVWKSHMVKSGAHCILGKSQDMVMTMPDAWQFQIYYTTHRLGTVPA